MNVALNPYRDIDILQEFGGLEEVLLQYLEYLHIPCGYSVYKTGTLSELSSEDEVKILKEFVGWLEFSISTFS